MATPPDKIPESITGKGGIEPEKPVGQPPAGFESYMQGQPRGAPAAGTPMAAGTTPMDLARQTGFQTAGPSFNTLIAQAKNAQDTLGTVGDQLNYPNLKLKRAQTHLLKNKLQDANGYINQAGTKLGIEQPPEQPSAGANTIARFLSWVGQGQDQLGAVQQKLQEVSKNPDALRPGDMMLIQIKMNQAQNEIQYASTLLGKVIDSIKQIMSTQL